MPHRRTAPARVLIVDDDPIFKMTAVACLEAVGFPTRTANDGVDALDLLEKEAFDVALIDLGMPRIDGFRLIGLVRSMPALARLGILVVSSRQDVRAFDEALALGANAFQTKPIDWSLLPVHVRYVLQSANA